MALPLFVLLGAIYARVVPPGEAPDEPAHLAYVDQIVGEGSLPPARPRRDLVGYESYQPPLTSSKEDVTLQDFHDAIQEVVKNPKDKEARRKALHQSFRLTRQSQKVECPSPKREELDEFLEKL